MLYSAEECTGRSMPINRAVFIDFFRGTDKQIIRKKDDNHLSKLVRDSQTAIVGTPGTISFTLPRSNMFHIIPVEDSPPISRKEAALWEFIHSLGLSINGFIH